MNDQNPISQLSETVQLIDKGIWGNNDFLDEIDRRIKEIEDGKKAGSTWEEVKAKSKA